MRFIVAIVIGALSSVAFATAAEATRPISGFNYTDMCKNIKGVQPVHQTINGPFKVTKNGKCRRA